MISQKILFRFLEPIKVPITKKIICFKEKEMVQVLLSRAKIKTSARLLAKPTINSKFISLTMIQNMGICRAPSSRWLGDVFSA